MDAKQYQALKSHLTITKAEMFLALVRLRSVSLVAREMGMSPPRVSVTISRLEQSTGLSLFSKKRTTYELSAEGRIVFEIAKRTVRGFEEIDPVKADRDINSVFR